MTQLLVKMSHARRLRYCARGARAFCRRYDLDFHKFVREGLPAEQFIETGDALAMRAVELAKEEQEGTDYGRG